jgi:hypothetical protein
MEAVYKFAGYMNIIFDVIFHPIRTLQGISYAVCLVCAGMMIILGIIGFKNCYRYAALFVMLYLFINLL